jgi:hypothetical protein
MRQNREPTHNNRLGFTIASLPHREELVIELWLDDVMWGEVYEDQGRLKLNIYPNRPSNRARPAWSFHFEELEDFLRRVKSRILELQ